MLQKYCSQNVADKMLVAKYLGQMLLEKSWLNNAYKMLLVKLCNAVSASKYWQNTIMPLLLSNAAEKCCWKRSGKKILAKCCQNS